MGRATNEETEAYSNHVVEYFERTGTGLIKKSGRLRLHRVPWKRCAMESRVQKHGSLESQVTSSRSAIISNDEEQARQKEKMGEMETLTLRMGVDLSAAGRVRLLVA